MVSYTANKLLAKPQVGGDVNLWGTPLNRNANLVAQITSNLVDVSVASLQGPVALTQADMQFLGFNVTGTQSGSVILQPVAGVGGVYYVKNGSAGVLRVQTARLGTFVDVAAGFTAVTITDGTNVYGISNPNTSVTVVTGDSTAPPGLTVVTPTGPTTITLPSNPDIGVEYCIKRANGQSVIVNGNGNTIDGSSTVTIGTTGCTKCFTFDGTNWVITSDACPSGPPPTTAGLLYLAGDTFYSSTDNGATWTTTPLQATYTITGNYKQIKYADGAPNVYWILTTDNEVIAVDVNDNLFNYFKPPLTGNLVISNSGFIAVTAFGSGQVVYQNYIMYNLPVSANWTVGATDFGEQYVFLGENAIAYSNDGNGAVWTAGTLPSGDSAQIWSTVTNRGNLSFIGAGSHNVMVGWNTWATGTGLNVLLPDYIDSAHNIALGSNHEGVIYSGSGAAFTATTLPGPSAPTAIAWDGDSDTYMYVLSGADKDSYTSTDNGATWTAHTGVLPAAVAWGSAAGENNGGGFGPGPFGIISTDGSNLLAVSSDNTATSWSLVTVPDIPLVWIGAIWNGSVFCAFSYQNNLINISADGGNTWTPGAIDPPFSNYKAGFAAAIGSKLWSIGITNYWYALSSDNGATWTVTQMPVSVHLAATSELDQPTGIIVTSPTTLCIISADNNGSPLANNPVATTTDGVSYSTTSFSWSGVGTSFPNGTYGGGKFYVLSAEPVSGSSYGLAVSSDQGATWTTSLIIAANHNFTSGLLLYGSSILIYAGCFSTGSSSSDSTAISTDGGLTWTVHAHNLPASGLNITGTFNGTEFVVGDFLGNIATSPDGITWTPASVAISENYFPQLISQWIQT